MKQSKSKKSLNIPTKAYYTLREMFAANPHYNNVEITMRVQHTKMIEDGKVVHIGVVRGEQGAPQKVYAITPVTQLLLDKASAEGIDLIDSPHRLINAVSIVPQCNAPIVIPTKPLTTII